MKDIIIADKDNTVSEELACDAFDRLIAAARDLGWMSIDFPMEGESGEALGLIIGTPDFTDAINTSVLISKPMMGVYLESKKAGGS